MSIQNLIDTKRNLIIRDINHFVRNKTVSIKYAMHNHLLHALICFWFDLHKVVTKNPDEEKTEEKMESFFITIHNPLE